MKLAVVDIGSNAIRLQVVNVFEETDMVSFKKLEYLRFPLRLGNDVFKKGAITKPTRQKFEKLMNAFKLLVELYEVNGYRAVATSAMREADNGKEITDFISKELKMNIDIISGASEARILNKAIIPYLGKGYYVHIDVGGGSTELNLFDGKVLKDSQSFKIGSVRKLTRVDRSKVFAEIKSWINKANLESGKNIIGIGTGGNINKLYKLSNKPNGLAISLAELKGLRAYLKAFSFEQRLNVLKLNPDRADVIVPAAEIYIKVLKEIKSDQIIVPKVGLKDGLVYELFEELSGRSLDQFEFIEEF